MKHLIVPTLGLDLGLLYRLAESIDYPLSKTVINNGSPGAAQAFLERHRDWGLIEYGRNLGVAGSWNLAPFAFPQEKSWLICNDDVWFQPGYLKLICESADRYADVEPVVMLNDSNPFYCFVWTAKGVKDFGTFDENFWPAYYEDNDMRVRHRLGGVQYRYALQGLPPLNHGKPRVGGTDYNAMIQGTGLFNRRYWVKKWGGESREHAAFQTPHNRNVPVSFWEMEFKRREKMTPLFEAFMDTQHPSIYQ